MCIAWCFVSNALLTRTNRFRLDGDRCWIHHDSKTHQSICNRTLVSVHNFDVTPSDNFVVVTCAHPRHNPMFLRLYFMPTARNAHNNLQRICTTLADPTYIERRKKMEEIRKNRAHGSVSIWAPQMQPAELGNTLTPMVSTRSSFEKLMTQTQVHHQEYLKKFYRSSSKTHKPLSLQFPALTAEIKLDGERMIIHVKNGRVTMNTRNSKWFSELYGPVLGPPLRRALSKYPTLDVMLDGEIESWDNINKSLIPFGENRTIAGYRRSYFKHNGMLDPIDTEKLHDDNDPTVMRTATDYYRDRSMSYEEMIQRGENFWLKFRAFDILYVDGADKRRLYDDCGIDTSEIHESGSIIDLPLLKRKQILYQILIEQENEIEICPTVVIRCNGDVVSGEDYFSITNVMTEFGHAASFLDSTQALLQQKIKGIESLDQKRRLDRSNTQISKLRSEAMENFYTTVVEDHKFEGLVVKDLASPYLFGVRRFWWKFKPDYETDEAVDIDVSSQQKVACSYSEAFVLTNRFRLSSSVLHSQPASAMVGLHQDISWV